MHVKQGTFYL